MARVGALPRMAAFVAFVTGLLAAAQLAAAQPVPAQSAPPPPGTPTPATTTPTQAPSAESSPATEADATRLPSDPDRIRRGLERPSLLLPATTKVEVEGTTYRVTVTQKPFDIWKYWGPKETAVSSNVRTSYFSNWHHEYLRMVTPDAGRRAALFPGGMVPLMPGLTALTNAIEEALRKRAQRKAKEEVQQALEEFFRVHPEARVAAPAPPDKPPSS
jgi:hypothetical protein